VFGPAALETTRPGFYTSGAIMSMTIAKPVPVQRADDRAMAE
jgi:hypothetical protein